MSPLIRMLVVACTAPGASPTPTGSPGTSPQPTAVPATTRSTAPACSMAAEGMAGVVLHELVDLDNALALDGDRFELRIVNSADANGAVTAKAVKVGMSWFFTCSA